MRPAAPRMPERPAAAPAEPPAEERSATDRHSVEFGGTEDVWSSNGCGWRFSGMVRAEGLEPPQLSSLEPKSSASTNSATPADSTVSSRGTRA